MTTEVIERQAFWREVLELSPTDETSLDDAKQALSRMLYSVAAAYMNELEGVGKLVVGDGHQSAQKLAQQAADEVEFRWIE